ncbi:unnamed protein product [Gongylonema pulchrum]|uniref:PA14 domain-containing protein n=1 Tax=Gongylonema pulchrum TaxID=637853 RepID=A0A183D7U4_9BILA|nr:unnamed protein product [Gongylonema pulchrum]
MLKKVIPLSELSDDGYCLTVRAIDDHGRSETAVVAINSNGFAKNCRKMDKFDGFLPLVYIAAGTAPLKSASETTTSGSTTDSSDLTNFYTVLWPTADPHAGFSSKDNETDHINESLVRTTSEELEYETTMIESDESPITPASKVNDRESLKLMISQSSFEPSPGSDLGPISGTVSESVSFAEQGSGLVTASVKSLSNGSSFLTKTSLIQFSVASFLTSLDASDTAKLWSSTEAASEKGDSAVGTRTTAADGGDATGAGDFFSKNTSEGISNSDNDSGLVSLSTNRLTHDSSAETNSKQSNEKEGSDSRYHTNAAVPDGVSVTPGSENSISASSPSSSEIAESGSVGISETSTNDNGLLHKIVTGTEVDVDRNSETSGNSDDSKLSATAASPDANSAVIAQNFSKLFETSTGTAYSSHFTVEPADLSPDQWEIFGSTSPTSFIYNISVSNGMYFQIPLESLGTSLLFPENTGILTTEVDTTVEILDTAGSWADGSEYIQSGSPSLAEFTVTSSVLPTFEGTETSEEKGDKGPMLEVIRPDSGGTFLDSGKAENFAAIACHLKNSQPIWSLICDLSKTARIKRITP